jgi:Protein of unknown function (DUF3486)
MGLPQELRNVVERRLIEQGFADYRGLADWIRQQGHEISANSLRRFGAHLAREQDTTRSATGQQRARAEALPVGAGATTEELMRLAQERLCSALAEINQSKQGDMSRVAHAVAHLTQAAISLQRWTDELNQRPKQRKRPASATKSLRAGLSPATSQRLRNALLGIASFDREQAAGPKAAMYQDEPSARKLTTPADESENGEEATRIGPLAPSKTDRLR